MRYSFPLKKERLVILQKFIKDEELSSVRFEGNPSYYGNNTYWVSFSMNVEDGNKISRLKKVWYEEDNPPIVKVSFWEKLKRFFK